jgi:hypothetical protein
MMPLHYPLDQEEDKNNSDILDVFSPKVKANDELIEHIENENDLSDDNGKEESCLDRSQAAIEASKEKLKRIEQIIYEYSM